MSRLRKEFDGVFNLSLIHIYIKTVFVENPDWWNKANKVGNVTEGVYTPIKSAATRMAALLSGEVDFVPDPATQDIQRLKNNPKVKLQSGPELRVLMISLDQMRDESPYVFVDGKKTDKNPFKDCLLYTSRTGWSEGVPLDEIAKRDEAAAMIDHLSDLQALLPAKEGAHA